MRPSFVSTCLGRIAACVVAVALVSVPAVSRADLAQLVGYWPFDGDVLDYSGMNNHGTRFGGAFDPNVPGAINGGTSLLLAGGAANGAAQYVEVAPNASLNSAQFTLAYWFLDPGQTTGTGVAAGSQGHNRLTARAGYAFETAVANTEGFGGSRHVKLYSPSRGWIATSYQTTSDWTHAAWVQDTDEQTIKLYINGALTYTNNFTSAPSGKLVIGAQQFGGEGFVGRIDDVAMWNRPLQPAAIAALAQGTYSPSSLPASLLGPPPPPPGTVTTIGSDLVNWQQSTQTTSGGSAGTWNQAGVVLPGVETYSLVPAPSTNFSFLNHITNAAQALGVTGITAGPGVLYYRTTFELDPWDTISARLRMAVDNGAQVYINGVLVAAETSFVTANWAPPYSTLNINEDGSISAVTLFDQVAPSFSGWRVGDNEVVLAVRNPDTELPPAGGFAFRLDVRVVSSASETFARPDAAALVRYYGAEVEPRTNWDLNGDGVVGLSDVHYMQLRLVPPPAAAASVPEPSAAVLAFGAALGWAWVSRRRRPRGVVRKTANRRADQFHSSVNAIRSTGYQETLVT
jgi:hypothetical protein